MEVINTFMTCLFKYRINQIDKFKKYPIDVQTELLTELVSSSKKTDFGTKYTFSNVRDYRHFAEQVPIHDDEQIKPWIEQTRRDKQNVIWPTNITWFPKTSGATRSRRKLIPVSQEPLEECH